MSRPIRHSLCLRVLPFAVSTLVALPCDAVRAQDTDSTNKKPTVERRRVVKTPLQEAIDAGLDSGLSKRIAALDLEEVNLRSDVEAICDALRSIPPESIDVNDYSSAANELLSLIDLISDGESGAFEVLLTEGLPILRDLFQARAKDVANEKDAVFLLEILRIQAQYATSEGTNLVIEAAKMPFQPEAYQWYGIVGSFSEDHPFRERWLRAVQRRIPEGNIGKALLESSNTICVDNENASHPFDSPQGKALLKQWLDEKDPKKFDMAHSAAVALAFIKGNDIDELFALALQHPNRDVQLEGAWAAGRSGREDGIQALADACLDVHHSARAMEYLREIGRPDRIPTQASDEEFQARAEFSQWLSHPNELGVVPDEVTIVAKREFVWPKEKDPKNFFVVRYFLKDRTGLDGDDEDCGVVGSQTWCFFTMKMHQRPPEDVFSIHAYFEMEQYDLIKETPVPEDFQSEPWIAQWTGEPLSDVELKTTVRVSRTLKIPSRQVAYGTAKLQGEPGHIVLDGERSTWYPDSEQPAEAIGDAPLMIHIGRQLLRIQDPVDRKAFLRPEKTDDVERWIQTFEGFVAELASASDARKVELCNELLPDHIDKYLKLKESAAGQSKEDTLLTLYPKLLQAAKDASEETRKELFEIFGALERQFNPYADALIAKDRAGDLQECIGFIAPYMDHNYGYSSLGRAAFRAQMRDVAEQNFIKMKTETDGYYRGEEMEMLAQIWHERGEIAEAKSLLLDCMKRLVADLEASRYDFERESYNKTLTRFRERYLAWHPDGQADLDAAGIPRPE